MNCCGSFIIHVRPSYGGDHKKRYIDALSEFYSRVIEPRFDRIEKRLDGHDDKFRDILQHFDGIYSRFEQLETEYYSIVGAIDRTENWVIHKPTGTSH